MLPGNVLSTTPIPSPYLPPKDFIKTPLVDFCEGGIAVGDTSKGLNYQAWEITAQNNKVIYTGLTTGISTVEYTAAENIGWVAGTFDQSMRPVICYVIASGVAYYYWYDTTIPGYTTSTLPTGVDRPFCVLDDTRPAEIANSDVIISYVKGQTLYYRQQRDRYLTEYNLGTTPATFQTQAGFNINYRFQFEFRNIIPPPLQLMLQYSDDGGYTWSQPRYLLVGEVGQYNQLVRAWRLGQGRNRTFRIVYTENTPFTLYGADLKLDIPPGTN